jgi:uncharacterized protein YvpB
MYGSNGYSLWLPAMGRWKSSMAQTLKTVHNTIFKRRPIQSSQLSDAEKYPVKSNETFEIRSFTKERNHIRFVLLNETFKGFDTWYAYAPHVEVISDEQDQSGYATLYPKPKPISLSLDIPYKSQLDNWENPTGACNVTSIAMCLEYLRADRRSEYSQYKQFEDELYQYALDRGYSRHSPYDLEKIVKDYNRNDHFTTSATIEQVKDWLADLNPAVVHGYFTSYGHIVVLVGYDDSGFIVHDPYGEWFSTGYRTDLSGAYLHYSYRLIRRLCIPDGQFWVHFIS